MSRPVTYLAPLSEPELEGLISALAAAIGDEPMGEARECLFSLLDRLRCLRDAKKPPSPGHIARG